MELNDLYLQQHIRALEKKGCRVEQDGNGTFLVQLPDNSELGDRLRERNTPREWMTVLDAARAVGLTANDLPDL
jgi:hypothetical protein